MKLHKLSFGLLVGMLCSSSGCFWFTSKNEGEELGREVQHLKDRISQIENEQQEKLSNLTGMIDRARGEVDKLEVTLTKATRVLARNSADFGADMESIKERLREIDGALAEMRHDMAQTVKQIEATDKKIVGVASAAGLDIPVDESTVPADADAHFKLITDSFSSGRYGEVRSLCDLYLKRYPNQKFADEAQLYIGRSYIAQKRWSKALGPLRTFTEKYPKSSRIPEALYSMAECFFNMGDCTDARILVEALTTRHKGSEYAVKARALSETMRKNRSKCTS
jgi:TolA-binding protein